MSTLEQIIAGALIVSLNFYVLTGGADYGGGVWDLFAVGRRAALQRELIVKALGPIWEANHVWLILAVVILFTAFPHAFAMIGTTLHIPLTLMLLGVVLRGCAFTFRTYDTQKDPVQRFWSRIFSIASVATPVLLGITVGALSSGDIVLERGDFFVVFVMPWVQPFPLAVGGLTLALFSYLAAVYLTLETSNVELREDFRARALVAAAISVVLAIVVFVLARQGAPELFADLSVNVPVYVATAFLCAGAVAALLKRRYAVARACAIGQVTLVLWGWALAQYPYLVRPDFTIFNSGASPATLELLLSALVLGAVLLFPSFYYLFRIFKAEALGIQSGNGGQTGG